MFKRLFVFTSNIYNQNYIYFKFPLSLSVDEAQYWDWSNNLDLGYFSKPPFIAWLIASTTYFFGIAEWSIRLSAPIFHFFIAVIIWFISKMFIILKLQTLLH